MDLYLTFVTRGSIHILIGRYSLKSIHIVTGKQKLQLIISKMAKQDPRAIQYCWQQQHCQSATSQQITINFCSAMTYA
jgi:hypothetical protein